MANACTSFRQYRCTIFAYFAPQIVYPAVLRSSVPMFDNAINGRKATCSKLRNKKMAGLHASLHCEASREWTEPHLHPSNLVYPVFVTENQEDKEIKGFEPNVSLSQGPNHLGADPSREYRSNGETKTTTPLSLRT